MKIIKAIVEKIIDKELTEGQFKDVYQVIEGRVCGQILHIKCQTYKKGADK